MHKLKINSIELHLPFPPYPSQLITMSSILTSIQNNTPTVIESPTGTGKSFSILCSALGYANSVTSEKNNNLKIYICSRTHKQLDQLVSQLKLTPYRPSISILASRNQYCVNNKITDKNIGCKELVKENKCVYYTYREKLAKTNNILDIEEFKTLGKKSLSCPYYASRIQSEKSVITFAPYNYLLDPTIRSNTGINIKDSIIIIDEAHNIEDVCRATGSIEITSKQLEISINELLFLYKRKIKDEGKEEALIVINFIQRLRKYAENKITGENAVNLDEKEMNVENSNKNIKDNQQVNEQQLNVKNELLNMQIDSDVVNRISKAIKILRTKEVLSNHTLHLIESIVFVLKLIFKGKEKEYAYEFVNENYKVTNKNNLNYKINFILLDPSIIFKPLVDNAKTVILLSGTLSPFNIIRDELSTNFRTVIAPSIVNSKNIFIRSIAYNNKTLLKNTFANNRNHEYIRLIALTVYNIHKNTKGGTLVFVPSYNYLESLQKVLKELKINKLYTEPSKNTNDNFTSSPFESKNSLTETLKLYRANIKHNPLLLAVYRGKISEGIDFSDEYCRAVIAIGLPYSNTKDFNVMSKKIYNDKKNGSGNLWYEINSYRAINQAIGRVVRHKGDFGAVFLIDSRYKEERVKNNLSKWVKDNLKEANDFNECKEEYKSFVEEMCKNMPKEKDKIKRNIIEKYITIENPKEINTKEGYKNNYKDFKKENSHKKTDKDINNHYTEKNYNNFKESNNLDKSIKEGIKRIRQTEKSAYLNNLSNSNETLEDKNNK